MINWYQSKRSPAMAEGTRMKTMEEALRRTETQISELQQFMASTQTFMASTQTFIDSTSQRLDENQTRHDEHQRSFEELKDMMRSLLVARSANPTPPIAPILVSVSLISRGTPSTEPRFREAGSSSIVRPVLIPPLKKHEITQAMIEQWVHSTSSRERVQEHLNNGGLPDKGENTIPPDFTSEFATLAPSNLGMELNLEANYEEQDRGELCSLTENQEIKELQDSPVIFDTLVVISEIASVEMGDVIDDLETGEIVVDSIEIDSIEIRGTDVKMYSIEFLEKIPAHKVFVKMLEKQMVGYVELLSTVEDSFRSIDSIRSFVFDRGKSNVFVRNFDSEGVHILVFDPGGLLANAVLCVYTAESCEAWLLVVADVI